MTVESRMLEIIRTIGEVTPPPVRLSKLFRSPEQDFFSFSVPAQGMSHLARIFDLLAGISANIRYLSEHTSVDGDLRVQLSVDSAQGALALKALHSEEIIQGLGELRHCSGAVIVSLYPFNGQPHIAERIFDTLDTDGIEILGADSATAVFSCLIQGDVEAAISRLKVAFVLP